MHRYNNIFYIQYCRTLGGCNHVSPHTAVGCDLDRLSSSCSLHSVLLEHVFIPSLAYLYYAFFPTFPPSLGCSFSPLLSVASLTFKISSIINSQECSLSLHIHSS